MDYPDISSATFNWSIRNDVSINWSSWANTARAVALNDLARGDIKLEVVFANGERKNLTILLNSITANFAITQDNIFLTVKYSHEDMEIVTFNETSMTTIHRYNYLITDLVSGENHNVGSFNMENINSEAQIDISTLHPGFYVFSIFDNENKKLTSEKFSIHH